MLSTSLRGLAIVGLFLAAATPVGCAAEDSDEVTLPSQDLPVLQVYSDYV